MENKNIVSIFIHIVYVLKNNTTMHTSAAAYYNGYMLKFLRLNIPLNDLIILFYFFNYDLLFYTFLNNSS